MKLRVTIDTDECSYDDIESPCINLDYEGVATWWYKSPSYFVPFKDVEIISCKHDVGTRDVRNDDYAKTYDTHKECLNCGNTVGSVEYELLNE
jgi:hypothetical protein